MPIKKEGWPGFVFGPLPQPLVYLIAEGRLPQAIVAVAAHSDQVMQPIHSIGPHGSRFAVRGSRFAVRAHRAGQRGQPDRAARPAGQTPTSASAARNTAPEPDRHEHPLLLI